MPPLPRGEINSQQITGSNGIANLGGVIMNSLKKVTELLAPVLEHKDLLTS
jgi:hypothetical protein